MTERLERFSESLGNRYRLLREIGHGGMATVYLAEDAGNAEKVAIKVLDPEQASPVDPARFAREIRIAGALDHPNILPLLDSGEAEGCYFYVMPFVEGGSLRDRIAHEGQLGYDESLRILHQLSSGLDFAHTQGVIHRDIKPENILLSGDRVLIADFGIARAVSDLDSQTLTATGHQVGTPSYASPEQLGGERRLDQRTDIYSLGCVLYEMLAGEPPFTGPTAKAVIARHLTSPPPDLRVVRPGLPPSVWAAVQKALSKAPADRFATSQELVSALESPVPVSLPGSGRWRRQMRTGALAVLAVGAGTVAYVTLFTDGSIPFLGPAPPALDPNKVVVFPLAAASAGQDPWAGWDVALAIGAGLEHTEPLKFIDGRTWLTDRYREDPSAVGSEVAREVSRARGAAHYILGAIFGGGDSISVVLHLHDVAGDSLLAQETATGKAQEASLANLALEAVGPLLPRLLDPGVKVDLTPLTDRSPAAIALSVQGDREYRQARFKEALEFYQRAVAEDSSLAFAATKGAQAASWSIDLEAAEPLIDLALRNRSLLPGKYESFAEGFRCYLQGDAQGARSEFQRALDIDPDWAEAAVAMAEVFYHLLPPDAVNPDSLAESWLLRAWTGDTTFAPPLYHLSEIALRRNDTMRAARYINRWRAFQPDTIFLDQVDYSLRCVRPGREGFDWMPLVGDHGRSVIQAGMALAAGGSQPQCARGAFQAAWSAELPVAYRYTALRGLFGLDLAQGRYSAADTLVGVALGEGQAYSAARLLYVYGALVGAPFQEQAAEAEAMLRSAWGDVYAGPETEWRWLMGAWLARTGEQERLARLAEDMGRLAQERDDREGRLLSRALEAHLALLRGDTAGALSLLQSLQPDGPRDRLFFHEPESLGLERILLAELQLARGDPRAAYRTAALLDHSAPLVYPLFLPRSLALRLEAAEQTGRADWMASARSRLEALGWTEEHSAPPIFN